MKIITKGAAMDLETKLYIAIMGILACSLALFLFVVTALIFVKAIS